MVLDEAEMAAEQADTSQLRAQSEPDQMHIREEAAAADVVSVGQEAEEQEQLAAQAFCSQDRQSQQQQQEQQLQAVLQDVDILGQRGDCTLASATGNQQAHQRLSAEVSSQAEGQQIDTAPALEDTAQQQKESSQGIRQFNELMRRSGGNGSKSDLQEEDRQSISSFR